MKVVQHCRVGRLALWTCWPLWALDALRPRIALWSCGTLRAGIASRTYWALLALRALHALNALRTRCQLNSRNRRRKCRITSNPGSGFVREQAAGYAGRGRQVKSRIGNGAAARHVDAENVQVCGGWTGCFWRLVAGIGYAGHVDLQATTGQINNARSGVRQSTA